MRTMGEEMNQVWVSKLSMVILNLFLYGSTGTTPSREIIRFQEECNR
jgi:hypothetical protein